MIIDLTGRRAIVTGSPRGSRNHDGTIIPKTIDTMWGTDMTTAWTREGRNEDLGATILIRQAGRFFVDADEISFVRAKGELLPKSD